MRWTAEQLNAYANRRKTKGAQPERAVVNEDRPWQEWEVALLKEAYSDPLGFSILVLSQKTGRTNAAIHCKAGDLGISRRRGKFIRTDDTRAVMSTVQTEVASRSEIRRARSKATSMFIAEHGHPKGMLGKHHTEESKDAISKGKLGTKRSRKSVLNMLKTKVAKYGTLAPNVKRGNWKASWQNIGGQRFFARSSWEAKYATYLETLKRGGAIKDWEHEPETFWFDGIRRGSVSYLPDFRITHVDGSQEYHEVKGWMDSRSKTKIRRMAKYHPTVKLVVIGKEWFKRSRLR